MFRVGVLIAGVIVLASAQRAAPADAPLADELLLKSVGLPVDGPGLVRFFKQRSEPDLRPEYAQERIRNLASAEPAERERALGELIALGAPALPWLRQASRDPAEREAAAVARRGLQVLERQSGALTGAAARVLAIRLPEHASAVLLAFLPHCEDENTLMDLRTVLFGLGWRNGKPDQALVKALEAPGALQRAAAIEALAQNGHFEPRAFDPKEVQHTKVRRLLEDPVPLVRLRAALAYLQSGEGEAVAVLIKLLADLPRSEAQEAENALFALAGEQAPKTEIADDALSRQQARVAWAAWWATIDGAKAQEEFRKRTLGDAERIRATELIGKLGHDNFEVREKAYLDLKEMGSVAMPALRQATRESDPEVRKLARSCLQELGGDKMVPLPHGLTRLLLLRRPAGTLETLLAFAPNAEDEGATPDVQEALALLVVGAAEVPAALRQALQDRVPARRGFAAEAVCVSSLPEARQLARKMLDDPDPGVRLKAAFGLTRAQERDAVPTLIDLLGKLPSEDASLIEDYLHRIAAERPPADLPPGDGEARQKRQALWASWWKEHAERIALPGPEYELTQARQRGYTVAVIPGLGQVLELGPDGKTRWQINGIANPQEAVGLPGDRVLIAEYSSRRVTERNAKGEVLWQKAVNTWPTGVQRLPNGHTLITGRNLIVEVNRAGREVFTYNRPANDILTAARVRDGSLVCLSANGTCFRVDPRGQETRSFRIPSGVSQYGNDILPDGSLLIPIPWQNKVMEYDREGKQVRESMATQPMAVRRLPNGGLLYSTQQWPPKLIEMDRSGKTIQDVTLPNQVTRFTRR
jgi:HEAT repeat protein